MASFEHTLNNNGVAELAGRLRVVTGTWTTLDGLTGSGGTINTGLKRILYFDSRVDNSAGATASTEVGVRSQDGGAVFPIEEGDIFVVVPSTGGEQGSWVAFGE